MKVFICTPSTVSEAPTPAPTLPPTKPIPTGEYWCSITRSIYWLARCALSVCIPLLMEILMVLDAEFTLIRNILIFVVCTWLLLDIHWKQWCIDILRIRRDGHYLCELERFHSSICCLTYVSYLHGQPSTLKRSRVQVKIHTPLSILNCWRAGSW